MPHTPTTAEVVAQLATQNDAMVQMRRMVEELRGRLEVGDADRVRLQQQAVQGEQLRQQDVGRMQELRDQAAAATAAATTGRGPRTEGMFDTKGLNKPVVFDSASTKSFPLWSFKFSNYFAGIHDKAKLVLEYVKDLSEEVSESDRDTLGHDVLDLKKLSTDLYMALASL